ncbi:unnamed protein product [Parajaminaea phylloscopi]
MGPTAGRYPDLLQHLKGYAATSFLASQTTERLSVLHVPRKLGRMPTRKPGLVEYGTSQPLSMTIYQTSPATLST